MKDYELTVLIHPDLEMNLEPATTKIKSLIEKNGGKITKEENDGKKRLAYDIKGQSFAVYITTRCRCQPMLQLRLRAL